MHPQLTLIVDELRAAELRLHRLAARLAPLDWTRATPGHWSVAECVEHLNITSRAFVPLLETALAEARALGEGAPRRYRRDPKGWFLWKVMPPPVRLRVPTPPAFVPGAGKPPAELLNEFNRLQATLIRITRSADGLPIQKVRVPSPFRTGTAYNAFAALTIIPPHQERHLWQAERAVGTE